MKKPRRMIIYNLLPLLAGKVGQWEDHFKRASGMGFNWIFLNPIQEPGYSGSLYSIRDYFDFNPLFIDTESRKPPKKQVRDMIKAAERNGLSVMVDLVINHCAFDSGLLKEHPEWFQWKGKKVVHPSCIGDKGQKVVWGDLAKFNIRRTSDPEGLFDYFFDIISFLADLGFRGFRCDAAYQLPKALWPRLIKKSKKKYPGILFLAETLGCTADKTRQTAEAGFDYIFNSSKWWDLRGHWLMEQYNLTRDVADSVSFPENHDTERLMEELGGNINGMKQRYLFSALYSSAVMMPMGFEFGFRKRTHVVKTRPEDWEETDTDLTGFIKKVNDIKTNNLIFQEETPVEILQSGNPELLMIWKASATTKEEALIVLNKDMNNMQHFDADDLHSFVLSGAPLKDISPEYPVDFIPEPFNYILNPGQGLVYITKRDEGF
jgi:starch synthase (maltosyl-transferring)